MTLSTNEEEEDVDEDSEGETTPRPGAWMAWRETRRGINGGRAERVAAVRCWFDVRRHALRTLTRASGSLISVPDSNSD